MKIFFKTLLYIVIVLIATSFSYILYLYFSAKPLKINLENNLTQKAIQELNAIDKNISNDLNKTRFEIENIKNEIQTDLNKSFDKNITQNSILEQNTIYAEKNITYAKKNASLEGNFTLENNSTLEGNFTSEGNFTNLFPTKKQEAKRHIGEPLLAIIIDDVGSKKQVDAILSTKLVLTPSFFPPNKNHPNTPKFAKLFPCFMIHYPMEANHYSRPEEGTLLVSDDEKKLNLAFEKLRKDFPNAKFINNHTGSKFTSNLKSMQLAIKAMRKNGFSFIDSLTINTSVVKKVIDEYNLRYIYRSVFIDNSSNIYKIKNMIKKAIALAKKRGHAIAIGHPRINTIKALKESNFSGVKLVYIKDIYEYYK